MSEPNTDLSTRLPFLLMLVLTVITKARRSVLRTANSVQVKIDWKNGRHLVEHEQSGEARTAYGKRLLVGLAQTLTSEFGRGFDKGNLRGLRAFYQSFPRWNALRSELGWTHYQHRREEDRYAKRVSMDLIKKEDYNLNITRYVSTAKAEEPIDLAAVHKELVDLDEEIRAATDEHNAYLAELGLPLLPGGTVPKPKKAR